MRYELYHFKYGEKEWFFTSARKDFDYLDVTYKAVRGLSRGNIVDQDINKADVELTFPYLDDLKNDDGDSFQEIFLDKIYFESVSIKITEIDETPLVLYQGRVTQPKFEELGNKMILVCSTSETQQRRNILTRKFQRTCPNVLFDRWCGLSIEDWSVLADVLSISADGLAIGVDINTTELDIQDGFFVNGSMFFDGLYTTITSSRLPSIILYRGVRNLKVGDKVLLIAGCDQSAKTCDEKFNNSERYAGYLNIPSENPIYSQLVK